MTDLLNTQQPDTLVSVRELFGIDSDLQVSALVSATNTYRPLMKPIALTQM